MAREKFEDIELPEYDEQDWHEPNDAAHKVVAYRSKGSYMIPLVNAGETVETQWTIEEGDNRQFPVTGYSQADWDIAYNNKIGIQKALEYAASNGHNKAILPPGHYNVCYSNIRDDDTPDSIKNIIHREHDITMQSNLWLSLDSSVTISVMFDSDTTATSGAVIRNPYDKGTYDPHTIEGCVFSFSRCYNSKITGGTIIGEMAQRSFNHVDENKVEFTYGVFMHRGSTNCTVEGTKFVGFAGDAITGSSSHNPDYGSQLPYDLTRTFYEGLLNIDDGTVDTNMDTAYTTALIPLDNINQSVCDKITLRVNIGTDRYPNFENQEIIICWYDTNDVFVGGEEFKFLQILKIPKGAQKIRLCCYSEAAAQTSIQKIFQITPPMPSNFLIKRCDISECHRGGLSNFPNDTVIESNTIYNNGLGWKEGYPLFYLGVEGTRYDINGEDIISNSCKILNNTISKTNHGILMSGLNVEIVGNTIYDCDGNGIVLYYIESANVSENKFVNCNASVGFIQSTLKRDITFNYNSMINCGFSDTSQADYLNTDKTIFTAHGNYSRSYKVMYKPHSDHINNFKVSGHRHDEIPLHHGTTIDKYIRGVYPDAFYDLPNDQESTNRVYLDIAKGSNITINVADKDRQLSMESGDLYGLNLNGGTMYDFLSASQTTTENFYGEGSVLNLDQFEYPQYGEPSSDHTQNFYDFTFKINGGYSNFFYMMTNNANGTAVLNQNFYNCKFIVEGAVSGTWFYYAYLGAGQNVNVGLNYCEFDNTRTSGTVELGGRFPGYTNLVQVTKNNVTIKGVLDESDAGFNVTVV